MLKNSALNFIDKMLELGELSPYDLLKYQPNSLDPDEPEILRCQMEKWYNTLFIEHFLGHQIKLRTPFFTSKEIKTIREQGYAFICIPRDVTLDMLCEIFHCHTWIANNPLIDRNTEEEDMWLAAKISDAPMLLGNNGKEVSRFVKENNELNLTAERYLVLSATLKSFYGIVIDTKTLTWIPNTRYDKNTMLLAGRDSLGNLAFHAWLPKFQSQRVGGRSLLICDHHEQVR